ncbi:hypothetical protein LV78_002200 [Actinosynnema pretiosum]|nr:hypothetical protein [Actinosynnema pretiosum]
MGRRGVVERVPGVTARRFGAARARAGSPVRSPVRVTCSRALSGALGRRGRASGSPAVGPEDRAGVDGAAGSGWRWDVGASGSGGGASWCRVGLEGCAWRPAGQGCRWSGFAWSRSSAWWCRAGPAVGSGEGGVLPCRSGRPCAARAHRSSPRSGHLGRSSAGSVLGCSGLVVLPEPVVGRSGPAGFRGGRCEAVRGRPLATARGAPHRDARSVVGWAPAQEPAPGWVFGQATPSRRCLCNRATHQAAALPRRRCWSTVMGPSLRPRSAGLRPAAR